MSHFLGPVVDYRRRFATRLMFRRSSPPRRVQFVQQPSPAPDDRWVCAPVRSQSRKLQPSVSGGGVRNSVSVGMGNAA